MLVIDDRIKLAARIILIVVTEECSIRLNVRNFGTVTLSNI